MGYLDLVKESWKSGRFRFMRKSVAPAFESDGGKAAAGESRNDIRREMEAISHREDFEAAPCMNFHKEGIMKLAPFVKFREEKFGAVLFETRSEKVYTLNPTAAAVVRQALAGSGREAALSGLKDKFEDKGGAMEREAEAFLEQLKAKGLLTD